VKFLVDRYPLIARYSVFENEYKVLIGKPERKRSPGRPRCRWEDIRIYLTKTE